MYVSQPSDHTLVPLVAPLPHFTRRSIALAGGKGANLGELIHAGLDVPPGFVITTAAYDLLLQNGGLALHWNDLLASLKIEDPSSITRVSQSVRDVFQNTAIPAPITDQILNAYRHLGRVPVAVRSSATAEDLPEAAFAGQQETFLNILGEQSLMDAVRDCWASLWSERAVLYRAHQNVEQATVKLAVVVQKMVQADVAGVMFTANPVSGDKDELVIDANPGLGEAVVSGLVTPDHFVVSKRGLRFKEQRVGRREVIIRAKAGGGTEQIPQIGEDQAITLSPLAVRTLARLGKRIERHFGAPQDIEWAWIQNGTKTGKFFILQARPMTALPQPLNVSAPMRMVIPMLAEMWPTRPYPLDMTTFTGELERAVGNLLSVMIGNSAPKPNSALVEEEGVVVRFEPPVMHPTPSMLITPWLTLWRTRHYEPSQWQTDPIIVEVLAKARDLEQRDLRTLSWKQNIEILHEALALIPRIMQLRERYLPKAIAGMGTLWLLLRWAGRPDCFSRLISGIETKTTETNRALESLAGQIQNNASLREVFARVEANALLSELKQFPAGQNFLQRFSAFLIQYGHRETTLTISEPAWKDQPAVVLGILKVLAMTKPQANGKDEAWKQTRDVLLGRSQLGRWPLRNLFLKSLTHTRSLFQIREDTHFYATLAQPLARRVVLELGRRLEQVGAIHSSADIFHLKLAELEALGETWPPSPAAVAEMQAQVARRSAIRESLAGQPLFDPRLLSSGSQTSTSTDVLLRGSPGSPGLASGPARIVRDVSEFGKLQSGDVLVAPVTNPAWTPLFQRAAAVVVDTGGSASHAAIVAREYGVPAVMGTVNGTQQLTDGQWIQVDGSRGLVLKVVPSKQSEYPETPKNETKSI